MENVDEMSAQHRLSISVGLPLEDEPGLDSMTLAAFIRDVCDRHSGREALAFVDADGDRVSWSYAQLYRHALAVSRALLAGGLSKGARVGILMTNRPEWVAAAFGVALAGGVGVMLSTFATRRELGYFLSHSDLSVLLMEDQINNTRFLAELVALSPTLEHAKAGALYLDEFPFLRRIICLGQPALNAAEPWDEFLQSARLLSDEFAESVAATVSPADEAVVFFSSGSTALPKGIVHNHRAAAIQCQRWVRL